MRSVTGESRAKQGHLQKKNEEAGWRHKAGSDLQQKRSQKTTQNINERQEKSPVFTKSHTVTFDV